MIFNMVSGGGGTTIVQIPEVTVGSYVYNGSEQGPSISEYDSSKIVVTNATKVNAGTYTLTLALKNTSKMVWSDLTTADKTYEYTIAKADITGATVNISGYTYAGTKSTPTISGNTSGGAVTFYGRATSGGTSTIWDSVTGTTYDAGTRYCYAVIAATDNYNSFTTPEKSFTIAKATFSGATVSLAGYTYGGTKSTPTISGNVSGGAVTYYGRSTASGSGTAWESVTSTTFDAGTRYIYAVIAATTNYEAVTTGNTAFEIAKASFTATVSVSGYTYAGTKSTPTVSNNPGSGAVTFYGRASSSGAATAWDSVTSTTYDAGTRYCYAVIAETTNYNSYTTANASFTIAKATPTLTLSKTSIEFNASSTTATISVTKTGDGTLGVTTTSSNIAAVNLSGTTVTVTGNTSYGGTATITVTLAEGTNYATVSKTCTVTATYAPTTVTWSGGTDAQVAAMIDYARENASYKLSDYWSVGDVRTISISAFTGGGSVSHAAQSIDIVITSFDEYEGCGNIMQFDFKDQLATGNRMNSSDTNVGGYDSTEMYTTTLPALVNALPAWLKNRLKTFSVKATSGNKSSTIETITGNKLALRSNIEVNLRATTPGSSGYEGEGKPIPYYATTSNRVKTRGHSGSADYWWLRSPYLSAATFFCLVNSDGSAYNSIASLAYGVAPFGCI